MTDATERDDFLDFPGADELIAAGTVASLSDAEVMAVRDMVVLRAEREAEQASSAMAHDSVIPIAAARRGGPAASLAPPGDLRGDPLVVLGPDEPGPAPRRRRLSRRGRVLVAAAAVAAIAAGAAVYPVLDVSDKPPSTASEFLNDMAKVSAQAPATHGKYWMVHYWAKDGRRAVTVTVYSDRTGATWIREPNGEVSRSGHNIADWNVGDPGDRRLPWTELDRLPTEPDKLKALFARNAKTRAEQIMELLAESPASPDLRSALFQIVARTPGVTMTPGVKDSRGRPGTEIVLHGTTRVQKPGTEPVSLPYSLRYIIDPETSRVLEKGMAGANPVVRTTYLGLGWTNHIS
ncbi:hypothetical protein ACFYW9_29490 [Streptomyces sp. NPDC002698]|uniref:hypothetical protein n=1 Tax=Streptomyces sp. NPDC002698 TaxID=3364660 RepID=UPI0036813085